MILVDTSIWINHLRLGNRRLRYVLEKGEVLCHPFVIGEIACGSIQNRREVLSLLHQLPRATVAEDHEVLEFLETRRLYGKGIGWIDLRLLASAHLSNCLLWTKDGRLSKAAEELGRNATEWTS